MAIKQMMRIRTAENFQGGVYSETISQSGELISDVYEIPNGDISSIGCSLTGDGEIQFTLGASETFSPYEAWDGRSPINLAVTAWRLVSHTGAVSATVSVKTRSAWGS